MLLRLYIKNYAIIDELEINFSGNLNVITGETGTGKSILLGALSLILGQRADLNVLPDTLHKAIIEGIFQLSDKEDVQNFFRQNELDPEKETIIRREINPNGKSRAFVNDTPVNLQQLNQLSFLLVDLHQQFDTLQLSHAGFQLEVLDALAENKLLLTQYQDRFTAYTIKQKELNSLLEQNERNTKEADYDQFLLDELEAADFKEDELEILEKEQQAFTHAEDLKGGLTRVADLMEENDPALITMIREIENILEEISGFHPAIPELLKRIQSASIELQDVTSELQRINDNASFDEERIGFIRERLDTGYKLLKKHGAQTTQDLLTIKNNLQEKLGLIQHADEIIKRLEKEKDTLLNQTKTIADKLSSARKSQLNPFIKKTNSLLTSVGMQNSSIKVEIKSGILRSTGQDEVTFLFDTNKSGHYQPIRKVASGGELSRLMLCIKSLVAHSVSLPTLIFDEIDSGISGEAARQVANIMQSLALEHQVICITHQPQIASKANSHFQVFKEEKAGRIRTSIRTLSDEERVQTIAQMLSGEKPGKAAIANAKELMKE